MQPDSDAEYIIGSVAAKSVGDILNVPCIRLPPSGLAWRYSVPPVLDYRRIDGVFLKYHCPSLDTILWEASEERAYWVNPFTFLAGLLSDLARKQDSAQHTSAKSALYKALLGAYQQRKDARSTDPVGPGCVNYDYSRTRSCFGRRSQWFSNSSYSD
ncbi:envelope glycoprotein UL1 [Leporid alphaherpesvirus 4]|uniref:Envelope glycoprotein UL1 n=1 Tax=Leporid alphaherpesvirus 4 TaxID=481315 RepID=J9R038_9ALPH|nr:envelope glycoprotein UL1 [Leporid alphaherpesvirus 4]AFR32442.1 envelope glycoprotein UL1 [Leporid alphaherpesvirus 4]